MGVASLIEVKTDAARAGVVYIHFSDLGLPSVFEGLHVFLRRVMIFGIFKSNRIYVRLDNVGWVGAAPLEIKELSVHTGFSLATGVSNALDSSVDLFQGTHVAITTNAITDWAANFWISAPHSDDGINTFVVSNHRLEVE